MSPDLWWEGDATVVFLIEHQNCGAELIPLDTSPLKILRKSKEYLTPNQIFLMALKRGYFPKGIVTAEGHMVSLKAKSHVYYFSWRGFLHPDLALFPLSLPQPIPSHFRSCLGLLGAFSHQSRWVCQTLQWCCDVHKERFHRDNCLRLRTRLRFISRCL